MACSLVFGAPCQLRSMVGQEHGRTIPLADVSAISGEGSSPPSTAGTRPELVALLLELCGFLGAFGRVARRVRMRTNASELTFVHHEIFGPDRLSGEIALEDLARTGCVACLR